MGENTFIDLANSAKLGKKDRVRLNKLKNQESLLSIILLRVS